MLSLGGTAGRTDTYTYDADGRLTKEAITGDPAALDRTLNYTYDLAGNRATKYDNGTSTGGLADTYTYDADDRLTQDSQESYSYYAPPTITTDTY